MIFNEKKFFYGGGSGVTPVVPNKPKISFTANGFVVKNGGLVNFTQPIAVNFAVTTLTELNDKNLTFNFDKSFDASDVTIIVNKNGKNLVEGVDFSIVI